MKTHSILVFITKIIFNLIILLKSQKSMNTKLAEYYSLLVIFYGIYDVYRILLTLQYYYYTLLLHLMCCFFYNFAI